MTPIRTLFIDDNPADALFFGQMLLAVPEEPIEFLAVGSVEMGLGHLARGEVDLVLLDVGFSDISEAEAFTRIREFRPDTPVIILGDTDDRATALAAVRQGAQDYLVKGTVTAPILLRSLRYAVERQRQLTLLREMSLVDPLTGLYNRRGFFALAEGHVRMARRRARDFAMVCADLDELKEINDTHGHQEGDRAIMTTAQILRGSFRQSDLLARIGGDEFVILALDIERETESLLRRRLEAHMGDANRRSQAPYTVSISLGISHVEADEEASLEELIARADQELYSRKRGREASRPAYMSLLTLNHHPLGATVRR